MKAVIYARYSSDNQREESIEGQIRECTEYAVRNDITILSSYIDRALSARTADRPEFQRMIADSEKGLFDVVLVWKLDRFSRDRYDSAHYKHILKKNGVRVISARENISEGPEGIILESMLEGYAEYYSAELSEKIQRGQKENALKCRSNGGNIPLGYKIVAQTAYWKLTLPLPHWLRKSLPVMRAAKPSRLSPIRSMSADFAHEKTAIPCGIAQRHP
ncbi:MAG: recombinase family protein [Christensenellales bacterium]